MRSRANSFARIREVARILRSDTVLNPTNVARELGVCRRTIRRDIEFLMDIGWQVRFENRIAHGKGETGWYELIHAPKAVL